jgi:hypothetical protein
VYSQIVIKAAEDARLAKELAFVNHGLAVPGKAPFVASSGKEVPMSLAA